MNEKRFVAGLATVACLLAMSCRQESKHGANDDQDQTELPQLTAAELSAAGPTAFERTRDEYVGNQLAKLPEINRRIDNLSFQTSVLRGPPQADALDILPDVQARRASLEQYIERARLADPNELAMLRVKIGDEEAVLHTDLRDSTL